MGYLYPTFEGIPMFGWVKGINLSIMNSSTEHEYSSEMPHCVIRQKSSNHLIHRMCWPHARPRCCIVWESRREQPMTAARRSRPGEAHGGDEESPSRAACSGDEKSLAGSSGEPARGAWEQHRRDWSSSRLVQASGGSVRSGQPKEEGRGEPERDEGGGAGRRKKGERTGKK